jgi:hypothetical protein
MELKPIERTDRGSSRLRAALGIYRELVAAEARNPEQQIIYWINHSKENLADEFCCFAIQDEKETIGYFQYSYFREEHIFFFEYLCIRSESRRGLVPNPVVGKISEHIITHYRSDPIIVFDVAHVGNKEGIRVPDARRLKYFGKLGFRKIDFEYEYPVLQTFGRTSYSADLMVRLPEGRTEVTSSEMRTIIRCVYFKHYLRWDRPFLDPQKFAERQQLIDELYAKQVRQIATKHEFGTTSLAIGSIKLWSTKYDLPLSSLFARVFTPKTPQLIFSLSLLLLVQWLVGGVLYLLPLAIVLVIFDCLLNDTQESKKLLTTIMSRLRLVGPR